MIKSALRREILCAALMSLSLQAASITVGNPPLAGTGNCDPFGCPAALGLGTYQQVYLNTAFSSPQVIQKITFYATQVLNGKHAKGTYTLSFSYTSKGLGNLDLTNPANNITSGSQTFYTGTLPNLASGPGSTRSLNFSGTPFTYNPAKGNLLLTIVVASPVDQGPDLYLDQAASLNQTTNAYFGTVGGVPTSGGNNIGGLVTGFTVSGPLQITGPHSLLPGIVGVSYRPVTFTASGGTGGYTWSATGLPNGLSFSAGGVLSGKPAAGSQNTYKPQFTVTDSSNTHSSGSISLLIELPLRITGPPSLPAGAVAVPYGPVTFTAVGGTGGYTWSATGLPSGLSLSAGGVLKGTPAVGSQNSYRPQFTVTDSSKTHNSGSLPLTIQLLPLQITGPSSLPAGAEGVSYGPVTFTASGGTGGYTWSATGLPSGLSLSAGGVLSGKPAAGSQNTYHPHFTVTDSSNTQTSGSLSLIINPPPLQITGPATLPAGAVGVSYAPVTFTASGGAGGYTWAATGLPNGLSFSAGGALSGTPAAGSSQQSYNPQFTVTDSSNAHASATLPLIVNPGLITIYSFAGGADGSSPKAGLVADNSGALYGATFNGGTAGAGTVFQLMPPAGVPGLWTESVLYSFTGGSDGAYPLATLVLGTNGVLYGTTSSGGSAWGTVFQLTPPAAPGGPWTETVLYRFTGGNDGAYPYAGLIPGANGVFYGTTYLGGVSGAGTVFRMTPPAGGSGPWTEAVLYSFTGGSDGASPYAGLAIDQNGVLYGATSEGGTVNSSCSRGCGTVFELTPGGTWTETVLYSFTGGSDGAHPSAGLVLDAQGSLYGTAVTGGTAGTGTVFELTPAAGTWTEAVLYAFSNQSGDGATPNAGLVLGANGAVYGTTVAGGAAATGTVFELIPAAGGAWTENIIYPFTGGSDGGHPEAGLVLGQNGAFYGTASNFGASGAGTVFELTP